MTRLSVTTRRTQILHEDNRTLQVKFEDHVRSAGYQTVHENFSRTQTAMGDVQLPDMCRPDRQALGSRQPGRRRQCVLEKHPVNGEDADSVVVVVGDVHVFLLIAADAVRNFELSVSVAIAADGVKVGSLGGEDFDGVIARVRDDNLARPCDANVTRITKHVRFVFVFVRL